MSNTITNGEGFDLSIPPGSSLTVVAVSGSYNASIVDGVGKGTTLATNGTGGTYGPYASGAVIRLISSALSEVDYDIGVSPVIVSDTPVFAQNNPLTGGIELIAGGLKKKLIDTAPILNITPTSWVELAGSDIYPICSRLEDGYTYGYSVAGLHRSTDGGVSWVATGLVVSQAQLLLNTGDGEIIVITNDKIYRTTGWGKASVTATIVLTLPSGYFVSWGIDTAPSAGRGICTHYGTDGGFVDSRYVWHSSDYCRTWTIVRDDAVLGTTDRHNHFAIFDIYANNRMYYIAHGNSGKNLSYSDDMGVTWADVDSAYTDDIGTVNYVQCTTAVATPAGIVMGDDDMWAGMFILSRATGKIEKLVRGPDQYGVDLSVKSFATYSQYDSNRELVYTVWNQQEAGGVMYITATDGYSADVIYVHPESYPVSGFGGVQGLPGFFSFAVTGTEIILMARRPSLITPADNARWMMRALLPKRGRRAAVKDTPAYRGKSKPMSPAVWLGSEATGLYSMAFGYNAKATAVQQSLVIGNSSSSSGSFSTVVGSFSTSTTFGYSVVIGDSAVVLGDYGIAVGKGANASAYAITIGGGSAYGRNGGVAIGHGSIHNAGASDGVSIGRLSKSSSSCVAIGLSADASSNTGSIALGNAAKVTHSGAIAIGQNTQSARNFSCAFGARDIELQGSGLGFITRSPNGTIYKITVSDAGALVVTAI